mgnify:CR=1 FL=1
MNNQDNQKEELEFNRRNREDYEKLMDESSTQLDGYWDKNNWFVKILLFGLLVVIVVGCIIIFGAYFVQM